ncbi:MAG TPA: hypothetical protein VHC90_02580, partial [Bryobacteraceae bacterium]|nr:hypothetical protein [Bryobacteraceae bacterium]
MSPTSLSRRELLASAAGAMLLPLSASADPVPNPHGKLGIGVAAAGFGHRIRANTAAKVEMADWAHDNGYGSFETALPPSDLDAAHRLRDKLESLNLRI